MTTIHRRQFFSRSAAVGVLLTGHASLGVSRQKSSDQERTAAKLVTPKAQQAIDKGLAYLASRQNEEDGSFGTGMWSRNVAICGLAGMAFMSGGSMPGRGLHGQHVKRCVQLILDSTREDGFITTPHPESRGSMYGHGFATLFLAEVHGMSHSGAVREKLNKAVKLIVTSQNQQGGWRYQPTSTDADISVTICQIMALRAARNAGIFVPNETVDRCIDYVKKSQNPDGGFMYMLQGAQASEFARSAAGVVALYSAGIYEGEEIDKGLKYLMKHLPRHDARGRASHHYFYGHYYAVQAMWHAGGRYWKNWYPAIRDQLVKRQRDNGSWPDSIAPTFGEYGTAMATIILQMPNNYLPIFQR